MIFGEGDKTNLRKYIDKSGGECHAIEYLISTLHNIFSEFNVEGTDFLHLFSCVVSPMRCRDICWKWKKLVLDVYFLRYLVHSLDCDHAVTLPWSVRTRVSVACFSHVYVNFPSLLFR